MPEQHALTHAPGSPDDELKRLRERVAEQAVIIEGQTATIEQMHERIQELEARLAKEPQLQPATILGLTVQEATTTFAAPTQRAQARWTTGSARRHPLPGRGPRSVRDHPAAGDLCGRARRHRDRHYGARRATPSGRGGDPT